MSTHNISFYENLTKIIFELSSNLLLLKEQYDQGLLIHSYLSASYFSISLYEPRRKKTNFLVCDLVRQKPGCTATEDG